MENPSNKPAESSEKKSNTGSLLAWAIAGGVFYYYFSRANIKICQVDEVTRSVMYKVLLGFKTVTGEITAYNPSVNEHKFFNKNLKVETNGIDTITFTITNDKGVIIDQVVENFYTGSTSDGLPTNVIDFQPNHQPQCQR